MSNFYTNFVRHVNFSLAPWAAAAAEAVGPVHRCLPDFPSNQAVPAYRRCPLSNAPDNFFTLIYFIPKPI